MSHKEMRMFSDSPQSITGVKETYDHRITPRFLRYEVANIQGMGSRDEQQDSFGSVNAIDEYGSRTNGTFFVIADGMGGMDGGRQASTCAVQTLLQMFRQKKSTQNPSSFLADALRTANEKVYRMLNMQGGSTVVACILWKELLWYAAIGDSCLFLLRNGSLSKVSEEHNRRHDVAWELLSNGVFDPRAVQNLDEGSAITSFIGMKESFNIDHFKEPLSLIEGDVLLLCSDGIGATLSSKAILQAMEEPTAARVCDELENELEILANPYQDNYTGIVARCIL